MKLGYRDPAGITHEVVWDNDPSIPMWTTTCGMGPLTVSISQVSAAITADCMGCIGALREVIKCQRCNDSGYLDNGWADYPCSCTAGSVARFEIEEDIVDDDGTKITRKISVTGDYLHGTMQKWRRK